jgi:phosphatidylglycerophosphatase A
MDDSARPPDLTGPQKAPFPARCIATFFFLGRVPWASGTFGSLAALLLYAIPGFENPALLGSLIAAAFVAGVPSAAAVARSEGNRLTRSAESAKERFQPLQHGAPDPSSVVIDEVAGMWIALFLLPRSLPVAMAAFVLFRLLDIVKPQPARALERIPNGWGIMLDDVVAGLYANLILQLGLLALRAAAPGLV